MRRNADLPLSAPALTEPRPIHATWRAVRHLFRLWRQRRRERRELVSLTAHDLHDIRVTLPVARSEARSWFWQDWSPEWRDAAERRLEAQRSGGLTLTSFDWSHDKG